MPSRRGTIPSRPTIGFQWSTLLAVLSASRPHNGAACALLALAGWELAAPLQPDRQRLALTAVVFLFCVASHLVNDIVDIAVDRANRSGRPVASGRLSLASARSVAAVTWLAGLTVGAIFLTRWWPWWCFWAIAGPGYSLWAKGRGWLAPIWTAVVIASCFLPAASVGGLTRAELGVFLIVGYFIFFREVIKNLEDGFGDGSAGHRSLAGGRWDTGPWIWLMSSPLILAGLLIAITSSDGGGALVGAVLFLACLLGAQLLLERARARGRHWSGSLLKCGAFIGLGLLLFWRY